MEASSLEHPQASPKQNLLGEGVREEAGKQWDQEPMVAEPWMPNLGALWGPPDEDTGLQAVSMTRCSQADSPFLSL